MSCTLTGVTAHNVNVQSGAHLVASGVTLTGDLNAGGPGSIEVVSGNSIAGNVNITGTRSGPSGDGTNNLICGTSIGHDLTVTGSLNTAPWNFGDGADSVCTGLGGSITVGNNVNVSGNAGGLDFSENSVGHDLTATHDASAVIGANTIGHNANCSNTTFAGGDPDDGANTIAGTNNSCP